MHSRPSSNWQYFVVSFVSLLFLRYAASAYSTQPQQVFTGGVCTTVDQPNPIASIYPNNATGTVNGTIAVIPIALELARQLIPPQYGILEHAYRALVPGFPLGKYPLMVQALHDHEVQAFGYKIEDFTRTGFEFPFLDFLNDNSTSFKWNPSLLISSTHDVALKGASEYGISVHPGAFDPGCEAYRAVPSAQPGTTFFSGRSTDISSAIPASISTTFSSTLEELVPLSFFKNVTNQVIFGDGKTCDNMVRLFNSSVTTAPNGIQRVKGTVRSAGLHPFTEERVWDGVYGLRMDTAFIENNYLPCEDFRGYSGRD